MNFIGGIILKVKIITDSASDLPENLAKKYDVDVLPFVVFIEDEEFLDRRNIEPSDVYNAIRDGLVPTTGQVPIEEMIKTFTRYAKEDRPCIYLSFSSKMSGSYGTVCLVAKEIQKKYPNFQIAVIDTLSGCMGQGLIVLEAAQLAHAGYGYEAIVERMDIRNKNNVEHLFSVEDLKYLHRGGRVNYASAFLGGLLNVKPILHVQDGNIIPFQKVRGKNMAIKRVTELVEERSLGNTDQIIGISHADDLESAEKLQELLKTQLGYHNFVVNIVGSVLACHIGLGGFAAFCINEKENLPNLPL